VKKVEKMCLFFLHLKKWWDGEGAGMNPFCPTNSESAIFKKSNKY